MKSILIITPYLPYPLNTGGNQAQFQMIDQLRHHFNISILVIASKNGSDLDILKKKWEEVTFFEFNGDINNSKETLPVKLKILSKLKKSFDRKILRWKKESETDIVRQNSSFDNSIFHPLSQEYLAFINKTINGGHFDLVQVEFFELLSLAYLFTSNLNTLFIHHEPRWIRNQRTINLFERQELLDTYFINAAKGYEINALNHFKHIITLSSIDKTLLETEHISSQIHSSPPIIQYNGGNDIKSEPKLRKKLLFLGGSNHFPNKDGMLWFGKEIAPLITESYELSITGSWDDKTKEKLISYVPSITFLGFVENLAEELSNSISIVPVRIGGGVRMKIIEAAQAKSPFITTSCGVEGLDFANNKECLIAENAIDFAKQVNLLLTDIDLQEKIAINAQQKIKNYYVNENPIQTRIDIYNKIMS